MTEKDKTYTRLTRGHCRVIDSKRDHASPQPGLSSPLPQPGCLPTPGSPGAAWSSGKDPGLLSLCPSCTLLCVPGQLTSLLPHVRELSISPFPTPIFHTSRDERRRAEGANGHNTRNDLGGERSGKLLKEVSKKNSKNKGKGTTEVPDPPQPMGRPQAPL